MLQRNYCERESQLMWQIYCCLQEIAAGTPAFSNHHPEQSAAISIEARSSEAKRLQLAESSDDG